MGAIRDAANTAFRDFETAGVPASGAHEVVKSDVRTFAGVVEDQMATLQAALDIDSVASAVVVGRASLYGQTDPVAARLFAEQSLELDFTGTYYRDGFTPLALLADAPGWTFARASVGTAQGASGELASFLADVPRITNRGLLIEGSATNAALYSSDFNSWSKVNVTVSSAGVDYAGAPASNIIATAAGTTVLQMSGAGTAGDSGSSKSTAWFIVRKGTGATKANEFLLLNATTSTVTQHIALNYDTGEITYKAGAEGAKATPLGGGWWLLELTATVAPGDSLTVFAGFAGDVAADAGDYFVMSHAQIEDRGFVTSRIVNDTGAPYLRTGDTASMAFSADGAFTLFLEVDLGGHDSPEVLFSLDDGTADNLLEVSRNASGQLVLLRKVAGSPAEQALGDKIGARRVRLAVVSVGDRTDVTVDGGALISQGLPRPGGLSRLWLGQSASGSRVNGYLRRLLILQRAATAAEARAMTTPDTVLPLTDAPLTGNSMQGRFNPRTAATPTGEYGLQPVAIYGSLPVDLLIAENFGPSATIVRKDGAVIRDRTHLGRWIDVDPLTGLLLVGEPSRRSVRWLDRGGAEMHRWTIPVAMAGEIYGLRTNGTQMVINAVSGANGETRIFDLDGDGVPTDSGTVFAAFTGASKVARSMLIDGGLLWIASLGDPINAQGCEGALQAYDIDTGAQVDSYYGHYPNDVDRLPSGEIVWADEHLDRIRGVVQATDTVRTVMAGLQVTADYEPAVSSVAANVQARIVAGSNLEAAAVEFRGVNGLYAPNGVSVISQGLYAIADTDNSRVIIARETETWEPDVVAVIAHLNEPTKVRVIPA